MVDYYFNKYYDDIKFPRGTENKPGLRIAQIGAIHAISSFFTLKKSQAAIVVMPTGSGKTAVLMMTPYITGSKKVLVVTPSKMVRGQILEDFSNLNTLIRSTVVTKELSKPVVYEMKHIYKKEQDDEIKLANVIVATPACALSLTEEQLLIDEIDTVLIDEAHHVPAKTWTEILTNMKHAKQVLFTATPFRMDKREIKGDIIFNYPLSLAYKDGIFGDIEYIPIEKNKNKDYLIAKKTEYVFSNDREKGYEHFIMVRVGSKKRAKDLEILYKENTNLILKRIDSSMSNLTIKSTIDDLKGKKLDGIICVNMLGEGFDFPNLKIAAIHDSHKSLANTLQFIGRFGRTNTKNIDVAKFIAMNDEELIIENNSLYRSDAIWQEMIINLSETTINKQESSNHYINEYHENVAEGLNNIDQFSLHGVKINCHAKVFRVDDFNINAQFPMIFNIEIGPFINENENTVIAIGNDSITPKWYTEETIKNEERLLYIVHYQKATKLLFIYSQNKSEAIYESIINAFSSSFTRLAKHEMHRVLGNLKDFEIFNSGMKNRFNELGESYRISAGSDVSQAIDPSSGKLYSAGHVFCKATTKDESITIGYSSGSKIWSSAYFSLKDYIKWCDLNGYKITNNDLKVKTNTNYDCIPVPKRLTYYSSKIFMVDFSGDTYSNPPIIYNDNAESTQGLLIDLSIKIKKITNEYIKVILNLDDLVEEVRCNTEGQYISTRSNIKVSVGRDKVRLDNYLNENPLIFRTTDDVMIQGIEVSQGDPNAIVFSRDNIISIRWKRDYDADVSVEFNNSKTPKGTISIHTALQSILESDQKLNYIIYDHSTGEIADFITVEEKDYEFEIILYHVKSMSAKNYNSSVGDIYEVTGQAIKSLIWLKNRATILQKIAKRRESNKCNFIRGDYDDFYAKIKKQDKMIKGKIVVVQPSISKNSTIPDKIQEVLAATRYYISNSGIVNDFKIMGSE